MIKNLGNPSHGDLYAVGCEFFIDDDGYNGFRVIIEEVAPDAVAGFRSGIRSRIKDSMVTKMA